MCGWLSALLQGQSCLVSCPPIRIRVPSVASASCGFPWILLCSLFIFWLRKCWPCSVLSFYRVTSVGGPEWFFQPYSVISCFSRYGLVQWIFKGIYFTSEDVGAHGIFCSCCLVCLVYVHLIFGGASNFFMVLCSFIFMELPASAKNLWTLRTLENSGELWRTLENSGVLWSSQSSKIFCWWVLGVLSGFSNHTVWYLTLAGIG